MNTADAHETMTALHLMRAALAHLQAKTAESRANLFTEIARADLLHGSQRSAELQAVADTLACRAWQRQTTKGA